VKPDAIADPAPPRLVARGHAGDTMPTIGIDATGLHGMTFGIHVYAGRLVESILAKDDRHRFTIFCRKDIPPSFLGRHPKVSFRIAPFGNRKFCEQCWLSWELARAPVGLFHATYGGPLYAPSPIVLTVHDLFHLRYPDRYPRWRRLYTRTAVVRTARRARAIITVSEATRRDVIDLLDIAPERVTTIHSGVDFEQFRTASDPERALVLRRHSLPSRYFLHVGGFSPIKNTERIVEAFAQAVREPALRDLHLVFAGKKSAHYGDTAATSRRLGVEERVLFTGYFPSEDLAALYSAAEALIYPSLIEGFGFPILEAFACGTPVITSDRTSLPEVAGDAALLVNPDSSADLAAAMVRLVAQGGLRERLIRRGAQRVKSFTWDQTAEKTLAVYREVLEPSLRLA
jgi:glycosyltransferase involved in cell wall biosynthesis